MQKPIVPARFKEKQKKRRESAANKQVSLIIFTLIALALVAFGSYYFFLPKQQKFVLDFYTYTAVDSRDFLETLTVKGTVLPKHVEIVAPKVGGTIEEILITEGQDVQRGDPLFRLYSPEVVAEKNAAETELGEARAKLAQLAMEHELEMDAERVKNIQAREELAAAEENLKLQTILFDYGSIPKVDLDKAEQSLETARRRVAQSERELELLVRRHGADQAAAEKAIAIAAEKLSKALEKIENFLVTAPISGRILSLKIPNNRIVSAHQELGTLANLTSQIVELNVAPGQTERFGIGTNVTISLGQAEYAGEIAYIAPRAEQGTDGPRVLVRVDFLEEVSHLRPYSSVTAGIHLQLQKDSLFLPRGAYLTSGQQLFVYVIDGKQAVRRDVQFGMLDGNTVQILRGLALGEQVIISSYDAFRHLEEIEILPEGGHAL